MKSFVHVVCNIHVKQEQVVRSIGIWTYVVTCNKHFRKLLGFAIHVKVKSAWFFCRSDLEMEFKLLSKKIISAKCGLKIRSEFIKEGSAMWVKKSPSNEINSNIRIAQCKLTQEISLLCPSYSIPDCFSYRITSTQSNTKIAHFISHLHCTAPGRGNITHLPPNKW